MPKKVKVYLTSNVFTEDEIGSNEKISVKIRETITSLWQELNKLAEFKIFDGRFPDEEEIESDIETFNPDILGCHLSHKISSDLLARSAIFAILTSTAGYNHIGRLVADDILITHTPGILHETVADYTIALILANLRNIIDLHTYLWNGKWDSEEKWDLDQNLSSALYNKVLGIVGLGEIGSTVIKKLYSWGLKIIYSDITRHPEFEMQFPPIEYREDIKAIFAESDIISLHIPLNESTENLINRDLFKLMKRNSLLINTARGGIINFDDLLELLEKREIQIHLSFDVYPQEPLPVKILERFKKIKKERPDLRMILMPHNASADADTRGKMVILFLEDLIKIIKSSKIEDLRDIHLIPEHMKQLTSKEWRIFKYWDIKKGKLI